MTESAQLMIEQIQKYNEGSFLWIFWLISFVYLMVKNQNFRQRIGYPMLIMLFFVLNPLLYVPVWKRLMDATYWRLFWLLMENIICVYAVIYFCQSCQSKMKYLVLCFSIVGVLITGRNIYASEFSWAENRYKIPQDAIDVSDTLLSMDDDPFIVAPDSLFCYIRQYSNDIDMLYGRDVYGYTLHVTEWDYVQLNNELKERHPDFDLVGHLSRRHHVEYIVSRRKDKYKLMKEYGYSLCTRVGKYYIYASSEVE